MNKWQKLVGMLIFGAIGFFLGCTRSIDYSDGEKVTYSDLPEEVQDTLVWWGEPQVFSIDDTISVVDFPDVICFRSDYSFLRSTFGPWIISRRLRRNKDGKEWAFSGNINIPTPIVSVGDTIFIPAQYNLIGITPLDTNAVFFRHILK